MLPDIEGVDRAAMATRVAYRAGQSRLRIRKLAQQARDRLAEYLDDIATDIGVDSEEVGGTSRRPRGGDGG